MSKMTSQEIDNFLSLKLAECELAIFKHINETNELLEKSGALFAGEIDEKERL